MALRNPVDTASPGGPCAAALGAVFDAMPAALAVVALTFITVSLARPEVRFLPVLV